MRPLGICANHADLEFLLLVFHLFLGFQQDFGYFWEGFLDGEIMIVDLFDFSANRGTTTAACATIVLVART